MSDSDSDNSSIDLPALPYLLPSSNRKPKSVKSTAELLKEHQSLAMDVQIDNISNNNIEETLRRLETVPAQEAEESPPESPAPLTTEDKLFKIFCINDSLQFFNTRDVTPSLCGYERRCIDSFPVHIYEREVLSIERAELEHAISSFLFSSHAYCISDCKSYVTYLLRSMSIYGDLACINACHNALISLLNKHEDAKALTFSSAEIFMLLFNYGTDIDSFEFLQKWPDVKKSLDEPQWQSKKYNRIPNKWTVNLKIILKSVMDLVSTCKFKAKDLYRMIIFFLWMSLDSVILKDNLYSTVRECIYVCLEHIPDEKWSKTLCDISNTLMSMTFSLPQDKWKKIYDMTECVPNRCQRGVQMGRHVSLSALKCICSDGDVTDEENCFENSLKEIHEVLQKLVNVNPELLVCATKFLDISVRHLNCTKEDYKELCSLLKQCEGSFNFGTFHEAKAHFLKIYSKLNIYAGSKYKISADESLSRKIKLENNADEDYVQNDYFSKINRNKIKFEPVNDYEANEDIYYSQSSKESENANTNETDFANFNSVHIKSEIVNESPLSVKSVSDKSSVTHSSDFTEECVNENLFEEDDSALPEISEVKSISPEVMNSTEKSTSNSACESLDPVNYLDALHERTIKELQSVCLNNMKSVKCNSMTESNDFPLETGINPLLLPELSVTKVKSVSVENVEVNKQPEVIALDENFSDLSMSNSSAAVPQQKFDKKCEQKFEQLSSSNQKNSVSVILKESSTPLNMDEAVIFIKEKVSPNKRHSPTVTETHPYDQADLNKDADVTFIKEVESPKRKKINPSPSVKPKTKCSYNETFDDEVMLISDCSTTHIELPDSRKNKLDSEIAIVYDGTQNEIKCSEFTNNSCNTSSGSTLKNISSVKRETPNSQCNEVLNSVLKSVDASVSNQINGGTLLYSSDINNISSNENLLSCDQSALEEKPISLSKNEPPLITDLVSPDEIDSYLYGHEGEVQLNETDTEKNKLSCESTSDNLDSENCSGNVQSVEIDTLDKCSVLNKNNLTDNVELRISGSSLEGNHSLHQDVHDNHNLQNSPIDEENFNLLENNLDDKKSHIFLEKPPSPHQSANDNLQFNKDTSVGIRNNLLHPKDHNIDNIVGEPFQLNKNLLKQQCSPEKNTEILMSGINKKLYKNNIIDPDISNTLKNLVKSSIAVIESHPTLLTPEESNILLSSKNDMCKSFTSSTDISDQVNSERNLNKINCKEVNSGENIPEVELPGFSSFTQEHLAPPLLTSVSVIRKNDENIFPNSNQIKADNPCSNEMGGSYKFTGVRKTFQKRKNSDHAGPSSSKIQKLHCNSHLSEIDKDDISENKAHRSHRKCSPKKSVLSTKYANNKSPKKLFDYVNIRQKYNNLKKMKSTPVNKARLNLLNGTKSKALSVVCEEATHESDSSDSEIIELYTDPKRYVDKDCLIVYESEDVVVLSD